MTEKQYRLPKEITERWLQALRSGEYQQGTGYLLGEEDDREAGEEPVSTDELCCLGVLCKINGATDEEIIGRELPEDELEKYIPVELIGNPFQTTTGKYNPLVEQLTNMNDGREIRQHSFIEIADWIEQNCTLYELDK